MKLYAKESVAQSIAAKMSKNGKTFVVEPKDGQFIVIEQGTTAPTDESLAAEPTATETSATTEGEAEAQPEPDTTVKVHFPGARLTPNYVITQPVGTSKKGPVERWIERARCKLAEATPTGVLVELSAKALKARGIDAAEFAVAEEVAEEVAA